VRRIVCGCCGPCHCGRWQCQSSQEHIPCDPFTVVRETLRWLEWSEEAGKFVAGDYKVYSYSIEAGDVLSSELQNWVGEFQWRQREGCSRLIRTTFCQAFFDPPRRGGMKRRAEGVSEGVPARATPKATHNDTPSTPHQGDLASALAAVVKRGRAAPRCLAFSGRAGDRRGELVCGAARGDSVLLFTGAQGEDQQGSVAREQAVAQKQPTSSCQLLQSNSFPSIASLLTSDLPRGLSKWKDVDFNAQGSWHQNWCQSSNDSVSLGASMSDGTDDSGATEEWGDLAVLDPFSSITFSYLDEMQVD